MLLQGSWRRWEWGATGQPQNTAAQACSGNELISEQSRRGKFTVTMSLARRQSVEESECGRNEAWREGARRKTESQDGCCPTAWVFLRLLPRSEVLAPAPSVTAWEMRALPIRNQGSHICLYDLSRTPPPPRGCWLAGLFVFPISST